MQYIYIAQTCDDPTSIVFHCKLTGYWFNTAIDTIPIIMSKSKGDPLNVRYHLNIHRSLLPRLC